MDKYQIKADKEAKEYFEALYEKDKSEKEILDIIKKRKAFRKWYKNNPIKRKRFANKHRRYIKKYYKDHKEYYREYHKKYHKTYKVTHKKEANKYQRERRKNDLIFKLNGNMRNAIGQSLKGNKKGRNWESLVNYTLDDLKVHLEKQFKDRMNWENYGKGKNKWNLDHKIPISLFNITSIKSKGFKKCWALENLQPIWASENTSKSNKLFI